MNIFNLKTNVKSPSNAAIYPDGKIYDSIYDFFVSGNDSNSSKNLVAKMQPGIKSSDLHSIEYFHAYGGIPIFSNKFVNSFDGIANELVFQKTTLIAEGDSVEFNIGKILKRKKLINYEKSGVGLDEKFSGYFYRDEIDVDFLICREINPLCHSVFVVSEEFKKYAKKAI